MSGTSDKTKRFGEGGGRSSSMMASSDAKGRFDHVAGRGKDAAEKLVDTVKNAVKPATR